MTAAPAPPTLVAEFQHEAPLMSCAVSADGRFLFAGGRDRGLLVVELATKLPHLLAGHESWIGAVARAADDLMLTADYAGRVIAWDCSGKLPELKWSSAAHPTTIYGLSVATDGRTFATGDRDGTVRIARTEDGKLRHQLPQIEVPIYGVALHPDGRRIVAADRRPQKPRIIVRDVASGREELVVEVPELSGYRRVEDIEWGGIRGLTLSPDGRRIVACGRNGYDGVACALVFDAVTGKLQHKLASTLKGGFYYGARFHPQGVLVTAGGDIGKGEIGFWDPETGSSLLTVPMAGPCLAVDLDPSGKRFVVALAIGKQSYPESGATAVYEWSTQSLKLSDATRESS